MKHWQNGDGSNFIFVWAGLLILRVHSMKINSKTRLSSIDNSKLLVDITCFLCSNVSKEFKCDVFSHW